MRYFGIDEMILIPYSKEPGDLRAYFSVEYRKKTTQAGDYKPLAGRPEAAQDRYGN
jgi:hypothetical protein